MKNHAFALLASACILVACQEKQTAPETSIRFFARETLTKTVFGELDNGKYPVLWQKDDEIYISYKMENSVSADVLPLDGGRTAEFEPEGRFSEESESGNVYYALSPKVAQAAHIVQAKCRWRVKIPASQKPTAGSVDASAQILYARYDAGDVVPEIVQFEFDHVTAYGLLSFSNLDLSEGETISKVTLTTEADWVGDWYYYVKDYDSNGDLVVDYPAGSMEVASGSSTLEIETSSVSGIWFACAPVDLQNKTLTAQITTNLGTLTKTVTFPAGKGNFQAGHVAMFSINMNGAVRGNS